MLSAVVPIIIITCLTIIISLVLLELNDRLKSTDSSENSIAEEINKILPQTQCGQCSYPGCKPYAQAISQDKADINRCPPGGQETIDKLAELLNLPSKPLDESLEPTNNIPLVALINEQECIGCLLCIKACPVDAIVGAPKQMHTVISDKCTGCDLCIPPCPMDCIKLVPKENKAKYIEYPDPEVTNI